MEGQRVFLYPTELDKIFNWALGTAEKLARRRRLPHVVLPDGAIRFEWTVIEPLIRRVPVEPVSAQEVSRAS